MGFLDFEEKKEWDIVNYKNPILEAIKACPNKLEILREVFKDNGLELPLSEVSNSVFEVQIKGSKCKITYNEAFIKTKSTIKYLKRKLGDY